MPYEELSPTALLASDFTAPDSRDHPWTVDWCGRDPAELVARALPDHLDTWTSGTSGDRTCWRRTRDQLWAEAGLLADLLRPYRPEAVLSFAPPRHVFGALATVLVPARLGVPVWYRPGIDCGMPPSPDRRWAVIAIPWTFSLLRPRSPWLREARDLTFLHSTATLPPAGARLLNALGPERARAIEVLGSTESGGVAQRVWGPDDPDWHLLEDTEFDWDGPAGEGERPLEIRSPRLASVPGQRPPDRWRLDDHVVPSGDRGFRFAGRRERLVKINGRRISLDTVEDRLRPALRCADLAALPVTHDTVGEHFDLYVVPAADTPYLTPARVTSVAAELGPRPFRVHMVERIERSATGKTRRLQPAHTPDTGVKP
ncbi:hypothetical protein GCM10007079_49130 [Nocardiopsis terrae]|nr:hypothetical protein GCM10007079_49130 [Nocardiopsis terrae]